MIRLREVRKSYRVSRRKAGLGNALKGFFARNYEVLQALDGVSFDIAEGEAVSCIGPNGAGKSSTIKIMSGILTPDSGEVTIAGRVPWRERKEHVKSIGVVFGQRSQLIWDVPPADTLELLRDIYSVPEATYRRNLSRLCELLDLGDVIRTPARQLSLGQRMRCEIAAALIHSPRILFLDEPTIGLDAVSKRAVRSFVGELNRSEGTTVLLTTHDMQDVEALTGRILLIGRGRILLDGSTSSLKEKWGGVRGMTITYEGEPPELPAGAAYTPDSESGRAVIFLSGATAAEVTARFAASTHISSLETEEDSIDDVVFKLYRSFEVTK